MNPFTVVMTLQLRFIIMRFFQMVEPSGIIIN